MTFQPLSPLEARVLGVLVEKQRSVPDTYPLSLNALVAGCNQKTSRAPIMDVAEADVLQALDGLNARSLIVESSGGRVMRYAHNAERVLDLLGRRLEMPRLRFRRHARLLRLIEAALQLDRARFRLRPFGDREIALRHRPLRPHPHTRHRNDGDEDHDHRQHNR